MSGNRSLVTPTSNHALEKALRERLARRAVAGGSFGELEPLAVRLALMQNTLKPVFHEPQLIVFAADHGIAVDGIGGRATAETARLLLANRLPLTAFARMQGVGVTLVDCGMAENLPPNERLLMRKIAHGTRNARVVPAMSLEQAHAAMRAGIELGEKIPGNCTMVAGFGVGAHESAALVLARLTDSALRDLIVSGPGMNSDDLAHLQLVLKGAHGRHREVAQPIEVLAAMGGFEVAVMVGVMLSAAARRNLLMVDGIAACAALMVAARIAPPVTDYCVFCRSHSHLGLDQALNLFRASALLELGLESIDGTGALLAWPMMGSAAALLSDVGDDDDPQPSRPGELGKPFEPERFGEKAYESPLPGEPLY